MSRITINPHMLSGKLCAAQGLPGFFTRRAEASMFLSTLIVINALAISLATGFLVLDQDFRNSIGYFPGWFSPFLIVFLVARLIALYTIWKFKRWGVYAFLLLECVEVGMGLFVFTGILTFPLRAFMAVPSFLVLLAIWFLALRPQWRLFG